MSKTCSGSYQFANPLPGPSCVAPCEGCTWTKSCTVSSGPDGCEWSYSVSRSGCTNNPDDSWTDSGFLPCGKRKTVEFPCDPGGSCVGLVLTISCSRPE